MVLFHTRISFFCNLTDTSMLLKCRKPFTFLNDDQLKRRSEPPMKYCKVNNLGGSMGKFSVAAGVVISLFTIGSSALAAGGKD